MAQQTAEEKAAETREKAEQTAAEAVRKANEEEAAAVAAAEAASQKKAAGTGYVVLDRLFVARTDEKDKSATHRYQQGETFEPVDGVHNVKQLVALGTIAKADGKTPLRPATALSKAKLAAKYHQEDSPVLDLHSVPFEQNVPDESDDE